MTPIARADTLQTIELADGVEIGLQVAGPAVRSVAWLVDLLWRFAAMFATGLVVNLISLLFSHEVGQGVYMLCVFLVNWFYNVVFEIGPRGATPGKRMMGLRVVSTTGGPVTLPQSIIRNFLRLADIMPVGYFAGLVSCLFTKRFQRLGDLVADTAVIYADRNNVLPDSSRVTFNVTPEPPRVSLTKEEQVALLRFLERAPQWSEERRIELANLAQPLTGAAGFEGLRRLCAHALWLHDPNASSKPPRPA